MPIEKKGQYLYRVQHLREGEKVKKTYQRLSGHEAWAAQNQADYAPDWRDNPPPGERPEDRLRGEAIAALPQIEWHLPAQDYPGGTI